MSIRNKISGASPKSLNPRLDYTVTNKKKIFDVIYKTDPITSVNTKVILCGHHIEIYQYEKPLLINKPPKEKVKKNREPRPYDFDVFISRKEEYRERTKTRVIGQVRRLIESNFNKDSVFLTLTFDNKNNFDITDLKICNLKFHNFMVSLKNNFKNLNLKYLAVPEFQKRGAVHYHLIINVPFIEKKIVKKLWKYGFIKLKDIYYIEGMGSYFTKYLTKNSNDPRLYGRRSFFTSKGLKKPKIKYGDFAEKIIERLNQKKITPYFKSEYTSQFNGNVKYTRFYIKEAI
ncbi:hypothetical protein KBC13_00425 [Candidatus Shapirobacteria bacterium]|jgi:hypothetical protein|nr:hypothetical protein [Candidatus Shapirobacteria bacterium]